MKRRIALAILILFGVEQRLRALEAWQQAQEDAIARQHWDGPVVPTEGR